jgi:hypothetical protein
MAQEQNNGPSPADPLGLVVAVTRVEVKLEGMSTDVAELKSDVRELKERRWPMPTIAIVVSAVSSGVAVIALVHPH